MDNLDVVVKGTAILYLMMICFICQGLVNLIPPTDFVKTTTVKRLIKNWIRMGKSVDLNRPSFPSYAEASAFTKVTADKTVDRSVDRPPFSKWE